MTSDEQPESTGSVIVVALTAVLALTIAIILVLLFPTSYAHFVSAVFHAVEMPQGPIMPPPLPTT